MIALHQLLRSASTATAASFNKSSARCCGSAAGALRFYGCSRTLTSRLHGVQMHPDSNGKDILTGGEYVLKLDTKSGEYRQVLVEHYLGSFWMMTELRKVGDKPILATEIAERDAEVMPTLEGVTVLSTPVEQVTLPQSLLKNNRTKDATSQCTILGISFKDYGYQLAETWMVPCETTFADNPRVEVVRLTINEGRWVKMLLSGIMLRTLKSRTPVEKQARTLTHFGNEKYFKDFMRMHNTLTGYVFLLDGIGRVRWVGSGRATQDELHQLEQCVMNILPKENHRLDKPKGRDIRR